MSTKGGTKTKSHPDAVLKKLPHNLRMRTGAIAGAIIMVSCLAWAQSQKEFIYLDNRQVATESSQTPCSYALSANSVTMAAGGGSDSVSVAAGTGCAWTATANDSWIHITSGGSGSGSGTVYFSVDSNTGNSRKGSITIGGHPFTVMQAAY
jgi:hypothetical protein